MNINTSKVLATAFSRSGEKNTDDSAITETFPLVKILLQTVPPLMARTVQEKLLVPFIVKVICTYCLQNIYQCCHCIVYHHEREKIQTVIYITSNFEVFFWH